MPPTLPTDLEQSIESAMRALRVPAFALAVVLNDSIVYERGFGALDWEGGPPADEHTTFAIASISKSFTASALGILVSEGRLDWETPVRELLPGFRLMDEFASRELLVRDLLIHNSGLPEVSGGTIWYGSDLGREAVVRRLRYLRPAASFRSQYAYQNVMYLVAGQLIPAVAGQSWDDFVQQRILDPLAMRDSAPNWRAAQANPNRAAPYARLPYGAGSPEPARIPYRDHDNCGPAASMHASAHDLAQYLRLHLGGGLYHPFTPAVFEALHAPRVVIPTNGLAAETPARLKPRFATYALGWRVFEYGGMRMVQHSGGVDGMRTLVTMAPEAGLGIVALSNQEAPITYPITYRVADALLGLETADYTAVYQAGYEAQIRAEAEAEVARSAARIPGTRPSLPLEAYAGCYASPLVDALDVTQEGDGLVLRFRHTPAFTARLEHWHYDTFRLNWRDPYVPWGLVSFRLDARARVAALMLDQPNLLDVDFGELGEVEKL